MIHWLIRQQQPINVEVANIIDSEYDNRLRSLLSVDDPFKELITVLKKLLKFQLDNKNIIL